MDGIYFAQGAEAAKAATCWADMGKMNPHSLNSTDLERARHRVWNNGFVYAFDPAKAKMIETLAKHTLRKTLATVAG